MEELVKMTARQSASAIQSKEISSLELVDACLRHIEQREPTVGAWAWLDAEHARAQAKACDAAPAGVTRGVLHGVPVGVKDVIDTRSMPTEYGSTLYKGHQPARDAACVSLVRRAGGVVMGKTVTTEFAMYKPNKTANPHNPAHTPGGSSSGSAAAVADYHVPLAFGTQTSGSIIRPAAYCGVVGYKPTLGTFAIEGVKTLAASVDTLGFMARHVDDLLLMTEVLHGCALPKANESTANGSAAKPVIGMWYPPFAQLDGAVDGVARAVQRLEAAGVEVRSVNLPAWFDSLNDIHADLMAFEVARNHSYEYEAANKVKVAPATLNIIEQGWQLPLTRYLERREQTMSARAAFADAIKGIDVLLVPAAPGEAPLGLAATGDPVMNRMWSLLGVPALTVPVGRGPGGLPVGVQLIGRANDDLALLRNAVNIEAVVAG